MAPIPTLINAVLTLVWIDAADLCTTTNKCPGMLFLSFHLSASLPYRFVSEDALFSSLHVLLSSAAFPVVCLSIIISLCVYLSSSRLTFFCFNRQLTLSSNTVSGCSRIIGPFHNHASASVSSSHAISSMRSVMIPVPFFSFFIRFSFVKHQLHALIAYTIPFPSHHRIPHSNERHPDPLLPTSLALRFDNTFTTYSLRHLSPSTSFE